MSGKSPEKGSPAFLCHGFVCEHDQNVGRHSDNLWLSSKKWHSILEEKMEILLSSGLLSVAMTPRHVPDVTDRSQRHLRSMAFRRFIDDDVRDLAVAKCKTMLSRSRGGSTRRKGLFQLRDISSFFRKMRPFIPRQVPYGRKIQGHIYFYSNL